jgi:hypothetical protein
MQAAYFTSWPTGSCDEAEPPQPVASNDRHTRAIPAKAVATRRVPGLWRGLEVVILERFTVASFVRLAADGGWFVSGK